MNIGLTGGIATGKSTVSRMLVQRGAALIDADVIAREIMEPGHPVLAAVAKRFGQAVLHPDGTLDRKKLGEIVFADPERRKALESLTHPAIRAEMKQRLDALEAAAPRRLVVADIPLLYESGLERFYERIMVVYVPRDLQLARLMERDGLSRDEAERRLNAQMDIELKKERADILIDNSRGLDETERQIDEFWRDQGML
ncbi:MAG: dephospho-CoA kinase [Paenibacillus macerans]|uniref:Dephospho-CoA kinase n=1 Tax=Paenibacillus macerans TaxID=44252 RepID=A0A090YK80_PAEMA|nr:dephospho-CoA kinase [Paenibacillus macerans]KFM98347.1 dephospho-CoA kinase [Paenibacillus macerans]MBS5914128.1 dephospho-CoA kinase [Paenibacillus macerans]MCY7562257.1 dephospho-CoA kinase [Paenibacillus macerans]MDU5947625.1 dephospho-CoA kinase [Paenibacillus macerans]MDU7477697.1 dephospho-CoA kinase [Paenibacillus macerans]